ncbi:DUF2167 domain-containing protein, partial [Salmonella enterica subsp. enterica serovar Panama]|nr:DUF2167 domain-containing protein [Salmonella enterica subsp. enterica serovar Panama]
MRKTVLALAASAMLAVAAPSYAETAAGYFADYDSYSEEGRKFLDKIEPRTGAINLPNGVTLNVGDGFYFVDAEDAKAILTDAWGNPPDTSSNVTGMLFPGKESPIGDTWGVQIYPDQIGYVDDKDAATINYDELLKNIQEDTRAANPERIKAGYDPITLIGWAQAPKYDPLNKRLYWAKELRFGDSKENTLNYDIRFLNRHGVLVMSYVASMGQLAEVNASLPQMLNTVSFDDG